MAEMGRFGRWLVNRGSGRRSLRLLDTLGDRLALPASSRLLELGAGRGGLSAALYERFRPRRLVVTDFDPRQVEAARDFLSGRFGGLPAGVELQRLDAKELAFPDASFDGVFAIQMLHHVERSHSEYRERPGVLREIRRILTPGGLLVYSDFSRTPELRATLGELGFAPVIQRPGWGGRELAVFRAPG